jgi:hypothetical protein
VARIPTKFIADSAVTNAKVATGIDAAKIADGSVSNAEFQYLGGVTSDVQTQLNAKVDDPTTTKGDLFTRDATGRDRLPVGVDGQLLSPLASADTGLEYRDSNELLNYVTNSKASVDTAGYATYADAAAAQPVDGTGGSPTVTFTRSTSSPLRGAASFLFTKDAANRQGEGASYAFTIDAADQGRIMAINFDYFPNSGTYVTGDLAMYIVDVTNGTVLQPSGFQVVATGVRSQQGQCTFQASINSTSYRLCFHVASTSALAYTVQFDNVSVGPQITASASVDTDWAAYTPVFTNFGTVTNNNFQWRREGPDLIIQGRATAGTTVAATASIGLPGGFVAASNYSTLETVGSFSKSGGDANYYNVLVAPNATAVNFGQSTAGALTALNASTLLGSTNNFSLFARIRIAGWGSNNVLSSSANTRVVVAEAYVSAGSFAASTTTPVNFDTIIYDNTASVTVSPTAWRFTAPTPGYYNVAFTGSMSNVVTVFLYKNGAAFAAVAQNATTYIMNSGCQVQLNAGDYIDVRPSGASNFTGGAIATTHASKVAITLVNGPQQITASEQINAKYYQASGQSIANNTSTIINYETKVYDSHNAVTTGVGTWRFTAPAPGKYRVTARAQFPSLAYLSAATFVLQVFKNGAIENEVDERSHKNGAVTTVNSPAGSATVDLIQGGYIDVRTTQVSSGSRTLVTTNNGTYVTIERVG